MAFSKFHRETPNVVLCGIDRVVLCCVCVCLLCVVCCVLCVVCCVLCVVCVCRLSSDAIICCLYGHQGPANRRAAPFWVLAFCQASCQSLAFPGVVFVLCGGVCTPH